VVHGRTGRRLPPVDRGVAALIPALSPYVPPAAGGVRLELGPSTLSGMFLPWLSAEAAEPPPPVRVSIVAPAQVDAGAPAQLAVVLAVPKGWHIYWENPGQSGLPTDAQLTVTSGAPGKAPPIDVTGPRWPVPKRFVTDGLFSYGYEGDTGFVFDVVAPAVDRLVVTADVRWLLCKDLCVTGSGSASATVPVRATKGAAKPSADPVAPYVAALPAPFAQSGGTVSRANGQLRVTVPGPGPVDVFPSTGLEAVWAPVTTPSPDGGLVLVSPFPAAPDGAPLHLVVTRGEGATRRGYTLDLSESP
jgi:DsbC/DsbD-like thiol-disulfide interchange protein